MASWGMASPEDEMAVVQALRADPPGLAVKSDRRKVFASALQQFEELVAASNAAGPASSPISLFYAMSQAGRAVAAARAEASKGCRWDYWGHGFWSKEAPGTSSGEYVGQVVVLWPAANRKSIQPVTDVAQSYLSSSRWDLVLRPGLGNNQDELSPFMSWWVLLYALSSLARYSPAVWAKALSRDASSTAVPLEKGLRHAREIMPKLVYHAITGNW